MTENHFGWSFSHSPLAEPSFSNSNSPHQHLLFHRGRAAGRTTIGTESSTSETAVDDDKLEIRRDLFGAASSHRRRRPFFKSKVSDIMDSLPSSSSVLPPASPSRKQQHRQQSSATTTLWRRCLASPKNRRTIFLLQRLLIGLALVRFISHVLWIHARLQQAGTLSNGSVADRRALDWYSSSIMTADDDDDDGMQLLQSTTIMGRRRRPTIVVLSSKRLDNQQQQFMATFPLRSRLYHNPDRIQRRQQRTRPRKLSASQVQKELPSSKEPAASSLSNYYTNLSPAAIDITHYDWPKYCKKAGFSSSSHVWITNVLSSPPATAFALLIASQCRVKTIIGLDTLFPNTRKLRMKLLQDKFRLLSRSINEFTLQVPWSIGLRKRTKSMEWMGGVVPSHIVHFDTAWEWQVMQHGNSTAALVNDVMEERNRNVYFEAASRTTLDDLLTSSVVMSERHKQPIPRLLHVTSEGSLNPMTIVSAFYNEFYGMSTSHLELPLKVMVGPLVQTSFAANAIVDDSAGMYVDDAMASILMAMSLAGKRQMITMSRPGLLAEADVVSRQQAGLAWKRRVQDPYEIEAFQEDNMGPNSFDFVATYGMKETRFPCASTCGLSRCIPSVFDPIRHITHAITRECSVVAYLALFSPEESDLVKPRGPPLSKLCRLAFVSGKSELAQKALAAQLKEKGPFSDDQLAEHNGKLTWNRWTLVWLPNDDDTTISDADNGLLRIDPSGLFSSKVKNAIYVESHDFASGYDASILAIVKRIDRPAVDMKKVKERRSGINGISRFILRPPEPARKSLLFAGQPPLASIPKSIPAFAKLAGDDFDLSPRQLSYYEQVSHLIQTNEVRPEREIRSTRYLSFPFQWISMIVLVHDLRLPESRDLRCSWYDEYLFWGGNRDAEELSLAYLLGKRRIEGSLGATLENEDESWNPLLNSACDDGEECRVTRVKSELFVRVMKRVGKD